MGELSGAVIKASFINGQLFNAVKVCMLVECHYNVSPCTKAADIDYNKYTYIPLIKKYLIRIVWV